MAAETGVVARLVVAAAADKVESKPVRTRVHPACKALADHVSADDVTADDVTADHVTYTLSVKWSGSKAAARRSRTRLAQAPLRRHFDQLLAGGDVDASRCRVTGTCAPACPASGLLMQHGPLGLGRDGPWALCPTVSRPVRHIRRNDPPAAA